MTSLLFSIFKKITNYLLNTKLGEMLNSPFIYLHIYKPIYKKIKPRGLVLINCQDNKMYVDAKDGGITPSLLVQGVFEEIETEIFKKLIRPGMVIIDIGANIGYYTLIAANIMKNEGKIYAFEPEPNNYALLLKNINLNGYVNVNPLQKAVSNKSGKINLFIDGINCGIHSISQYNVYNNIGSVEVETTTLDEFFKNEVKDLRVDLIKMDVQGAEGLVIEGAEEIILHNNLTILMEFCPYLLRNIGTDPLELLYKLINFGFTIEVIDESNKTTVKSEPMKIIEMCDITTGDSFVNLLLKKTVGDKSY